MPETNFDSLSAHSSNSSASVLSKESSVKAPSIASVSKSTALPSSNLTNNNSPSLKYTLEKNREIFTTNILKGFAFNEATSIDRFELAQLKMIAIELADNFMSNASENPDEDFVYAFKLDLGETKNLREKEHRKDPTKKRYNLYFPSTNKKEFNANKTDNNLVETINKVFNAQARSEHLRHENSKEKYTRKIYFNSFDFDAKEKSTKDTSAIISLDEFIKRKPESKLAKEFEVQLYNSQAQGSIFETAIKHDATPVVEHLANTRMSPDDQNSMDDYLQRMYNMQIQSRIEQQTNEITGYKSSKQKDIFNIKHYGQREKNTHISKQSNQSILDR